MKSFNLTNFNEISNFIKRKCFAKCDVEVKHSQTTTSIYIRFYNNNSEVNLRISDHYVKSSIKTIIVKNSLSEKILERTIENCIKSLGCQSLRNIFNYIGSTNKLATA